MVSLVSKVVGVPINWYNGSSGYMCVYKPRGGWSAQIVEFHNWLDNDGT